jgi:hypothetical protein
VLVIGDSASGRDISKQLVGVADCVTVSTQRPNQRLSDDSHIKKGPIRRFLSQSGEVEFEDGTVSRFDNIIWCTGYKYDFAFIKNSVYGKFIQEDFRVTGTYKHIFYIPERRGNTSLAFVGLLEMVLVDRVRAAGVLDCKCICWSWKHPIPRRYGEVGASRDQRLEVPMRS